MTTSALHETTRYIHKNSAGYTPKNGLKYVGMISGDAHTHSGKALFGSHNSKREYIRRGNEYGVWIGTAPFPMSYRRCDKDGTIL